MTRIRADEMQVYGWCPRCGAQVTWLTTVRVGAICGFGELETSERVRDGSIHFIETAAGALLICRNSLKEMISKGQI